jgi:hypothetical protein
MIFVNDLSDTYPVDLAIFPKHLLLSPLGISFVCLLVGTDPHIEIRYFHMFNVDEYCY